MAWSTSASTLERERNQANADTISSDNSRCLVRVIPTNEDLMIARHTYELIFSGAVDHSMANWSQTEGSPQPLGATWLKEEKSYNFSLYSRHATGVTLLLYTARDLVNPVLRVSLNYLTHKSGRIWHCRLKADEVANASYYAYSVEGPNSALGEVHFFDPDKVLLDPYARSLFFPPDFRRSASIGRGSNAGRTPVGALPVNIPAFDWGGESNPFDWGGESNSRHTSDTIIYEMHVRGFTNRDNSGVSADKRGTFAGVVEKIPYLKELGVTAVELMPVFQYDPDEGNYWGYMPLNFFSPHQGYAANLPVAEAAADFKAMVKALHRAGIEVILDVVYNHTTEAGADGPTYSYRGICNSTYYLLDESMIALSERYRHRQCLASRPSDGAQDDNRQPPFLGT